MKTKTIKISFSNICNISSLLVRNKNSFNVLSRSGVYSLFCDTCNATYVGQTGRAFSVRLKEHQACIRPNKSDSSFADHIIETSHHFDPDKNIKILHLYSKGRKLNIAENLEILLSSKSDDLTLNEQLNFESRFFLSSIALNSLSVPS